MLASLAVTLIFFFAAQSFFNVASGTGDLPGGVSLKWGLAFLAFAAFCLLAFVVSFLAVWTPRKLEPLQFALSRARERLGIFRWPLLALTIAFPVWLFQYSYFGLILLGLPLRLTILASATLLSAFLLPPTFNPHPSSTNLQSSSFILHPSLSNLLTSILLTGGALLLAFPLSDVNSYPFSLDWSEGNRLWDYSILFGRNRYIFPADQDMTAFIDFGRQFLGGLPFLIPNLTIWQARLWQGLMGILPYVLLGLAVFHRKEKNTGIWLLAGLWGYAFLRQGPIHTPLIFTAILVALAWKRPLWLSALFVFAATVLAAYSRFTWVVAPAMWIGMLTLVDASLENGRIPRAAWIRAILLATAGLAGGLAVFLVRRAERGTMVASADVVGILSRQPLLWYRLLPNNTLGPGILVILALAVLPLIAILFYLVRSSRWTLNWWQGLAILAPLLAFLAVGIVASAKIGGGGDLHNLDMFLVGLLFAAGAAWDRLGHRWMLERASLLPIMQTMLIALLALPVWAPLVNMRPWLYADDLSRLQTLADADESRELRVLPSHAIIEASLDSIRKNVAVAQKRGEVLFMDQRQLLAFGFVTDVPLVVEYEKKYMMDQAMTGPNAPVFAAFYSDLAAQRFAMIVTEPLRLPIKDATYGFGEENNAWVTLIAEPILCYYEPYATLTEVKVELFLPRAEPLDCDLP